MKEEKLRLAFNHFDTTNSGYITGDSVIEALKYSNVFLNEEEIKLYFKGQSRLNFKDFQKIFMVAKKTKDKI